jgi:hypothetical protein
VRTYVEPFHGCLGGNGSDHDLSVLCGALLANDHGVPIENGRVAHAVASDGKREVSGPSEPSRRDTDLPPVFLSSRLGTTGNNSAKQSHACDCCGRIHPRISHLLIKLMAAGACVA